MRSPHVGGLGDGATIRRVVQAIAFLVFATVAVFQPQAADIVWTNTSGGNWDAAANWSPNQVPGAADNAWITNSGTYTVSITANANVGSLTAGATSGTQTLSLSSGTFTVSGASLVDTNCTFSISGGTLAGSGDVTVTGTLSWVYGTMSGSGKTIIAAGTGVLSLSSSGHFLNRVLENEGTATWTGGPLEMTGGVFNNSGSFTANSASTLSSYGSGGVSAFNNTGSFTKHRGLSKRSDFRVISENLWWVGYWI